MKSIKKNFIYNSLLSLSSILFPLVTAPYIARVLSPEGVGLYNFAHTYSNYFAMVALLGVPTYGIREIAKIRDDKERTNELLSELFSLTIISTLFSVLLYFSSIFLINQLNEDLLIFAVIGVILYLSPININWFFSGFEDFGYITLRSLIVKIICIISIFLFVRTPEDLLFYVLITVFSTIANNVWNIFALYKNGFRIHLQFKGINKHIKPCIILLASGVAMSLYTILDTMMLGFMTEYTEVAYYNYAMQISKAIVLVVTSLSTVTLPRVSYYLGNNDFVEISRLINKAYNFVLFLGVPITIAIMLVAPIFVPLFLGEEYYGSIVPLIILSILVISIGINNLIGTLGVLGTGQDRFFLYSVLCGSVSNILLNFLLIPLYGATGASVASVCSESLVAIVMIYFMYKSTPIRISESKYTLMTICASLLLIPIFLLLNRLFSNWLLIIIFSVVGGIVYLVSQCFLKNPVLSLIFNLIHDKIKYPKI